MTANPRLDQLVAFVALASDICHRHRRCATVSIYLHPRQLPFIVILDEPCALLQFHRDMYAAAEHCNLHRTKSALVQGIWEYHYTPLPELADLLGHG